MRNSAPLWCLAALAAVAPLAMAEEVTLRDGRKLTGTIASVESGVYRLETDFGVALIKKEWIARIEFSGAVKKKAGRGASLAEKAAAAPPVRPRRPPPTPLIRERRPPGGRIQERIEGTTYINETYRFQLFKPHSWRILEHAARNIPSAVTVLGTRTKARYWWWGASCIKVRRPPMPKSCRVRSAKSIRFRDET